RRRITAFDFFKEFDSTLVIIAPPIELGSGVFRCRSWLEPRSHWLNRFSVAHRSTASKNERAFQKQFGVNLNRKMKPGITKKKVLRRYRDVGLGFKTPRDDIDGTYIDRKCPWTGDVRIRGRILTGVVRKTKMQRTIVIRRDYLHFV
ncbi:RpS11, partial [Drosophila busckii]